MLHGSLVGQRDRKSFGRFLRHEGRGFVEDGFLVGVVFSVGIGVVVLGGVGRSLLQLLFANRAGVPTSWCAEKSVRNSRWCWLSGASLFSLSADEGFPVGRLDRSDLLLEDGGASGGELAE